MMQERMFPIGAILTQGNLGLLRAGGSEIRRFVLVRIGHLGMLDKENR